MPNLTGPNRPNIRWPRKSMEILQPVVFWPRWLAHGTLTAQHDSLSTVQDGVCHVACLCAGREGLVLTADAPTHDWTHMKLQWELDETRVCFTIGAIQRRSDVAVCCMLLHKSVEYWVPILWTRSLVNCKALPLPRPPWMPTSPWHKRHIYQPPWSSSASSSEPSTLSP